MIRHTRNSICTMGIMLNAKANNYWATRHMFTLECKNVSKPYLDVLLKRLTNEGLVRRKKVKIGRKEVWGYQATELGKTWYLNPSEHSRLPRPVKEINYRTVALEETIEREGWVERWNDQVIMISDYTGNMIRKHMRGRGKNGAPKKGDRAKQKFYDCAAFYALTSYGKRTGFTLRLQFRLEPWRDHLAKWLGVCGIPLEAVESIIAHIERQLPGSFKQQEHRVIGAFGTAVKNVEGRIKIKSLDLDSGKKGITEMEWSRKGDIQLSGDAEIVDGLAGGLAGWQHGEVIRIARESGERERIERLILLLAQGKNDEVQKMLGVEPKDNNDKREPDYFV